MISPTPLSFLCALLLCLPLALLFSTNNVQNITTTPTTIILNIPMPLQEDINFSEKPNKKLKTSTSLSSSLSLSRRLSPSTSLSNYGVKAKPNVDQDDGLFKVAMGVKPKPTRPNKVAFMFLTNKLLPLALLWESYFNQTPTSKNLFNIYVHADPTFAYHAPFSGVFSNRVIPSQPTMRFSPTLAAAARRLLAHALLDDRGNSMFVLLSPACIPLHSFNFTYHALLRDDKSFIEILDNEETIYDRWAARGTHAPEVRLEDFRVGSQFWALTRRHAQLVVSDRVLWPKFNVPCLRWDTCYPEENYFPTLLSMWHPEECVHATLTHVNWTGRVDGHPRTYEAWEVGPELIRSMREDKPRYGDGNGNGRSDPFLFARKFTADALQPLMKIANDVIFRD
ncbi:hypothetical protein VNO78_30415 [Psophocarpus tetragonolobus]|uniref:Core-2/I-branching beta-1,6-N-acetylglucosaminyltransferase family protein n=1 Tax=Psophocarpus tetragonolobus TaxID=3891 RepID=A0AAN9RXU4_PSOTE